MNELEFIKEAKAKGMTPEQIKPKFEKLKEMGAFNKKSSGYEKGFTDQPIAGLGELAVREGTAAISGLAAGIGFIGSMIASGGDLDKAEYVFNETFKEGTFEPKTEAGKVAGETFDKPFIWAGEQLNKLADPLADAGHPGLATGVKVGGGAVAMIAAGAAGKKMLTTTGRKLVTEPLQKKAQANAKEVITAIEDTYKRHHDAIGNPEVAWERTMKDLQIDTPDKYNKLIETAGIKPKIDASKKKVNYKDWRKYEEEQAKTPTNTSESIAATQNIISRALGRANEYVGDPKAVLKEWGHGIDLRIKHISNDIYLALNKLELNTGKLVNDRVVGIQGFSKLYNDLNTNQQYKLDVALAEGADMAVPQFKQHIKDVTASMKRGDELYEEVFREGGIRDMLDEMYRQDVKESGHKRKGGKDIGKIPNYVPTMFKKEKDIFKKMGEEEAGIIERKLAEAKAKKKDELTADERARIVAGVLSQGKFSSGMNVALPSHLKHRHNQMTMENVKDYARTPEALNNYIREVTTNSQRRQMLGLGDDNTLDTSIARYLDDAIANKRMSHQDRAEVEALLRARFGLGEQTANRAIQNAKNIMYMFTIGHVKSAITQASDIVIGAVENGVMPTIKANVLRQSGRANHAMRARVIDLGITRAAQELETLVGTTKLLNFFLEKTQFNRMDRLGKQTIMDGAYVKAQDMMKSNPKKFEAQYRKHFQTDQEFVNFKQALKDGKDTQETLQMQFNTITKLQPVSRSQMPQKYLEMPNGRVFYQLKTFTIRQLNYAYDNGVRKMKSNDPKEVMEGTRILAGWTTAMVLGGASTDYIKDMIFNGGEVRDLDDAIVNNLLKIIGLTKYDMRDLGREPVNTFLAAWLMPPVSVFNPLFTLELDKMVKRLPIIGDVYDVADEPSKRD